MNMKMTKIMKTMKMKSPIENIPFSASMLMLILGAILFSEYGGYRHRVTETFKEREGAQSGRTRPPAAASHTTDAAPRTARSTAPAPKRLSAPPPPAHLAPRGKT